LGLIAKCAGNPSVADDVVQEAFVRLLTANLPPNITEEHRKNYLYKIATNYLHRSARRWRHHRLPDHLESPIGSSDEGVDLRNAMSKLREPERELLCLAYVEKLSHREIGFILGYRENSVRALLHRAKAKVIQFLERRS
jgi:RNA polymerase sigma-70 factor (ECF subfamily)